MAATSNPFGKSPGSMGSAFGQPAFGANKTAIPSSSVSNSNNSAFGAASNTPLTTTSPFGSLQQNASQNASSTSSAFGKPTFGAATNTQSPFGTIQNTSTSSGTGVSPFGTFGTNSNNKSPFSNLQSGAGAGSSPFGITTSKANNNNNVGSSAFGTTNNQSPFSGGSGGTFGSASNLNKNTNDNFQSSFGNKGFSFGITPQNDANNVSQSNPSFGQTMSNTDPNISLKSNGNATSFEFGQQQMNATNVNANTATGKIRFVQGLSSEKDGILELADLAEETLKIFRANKFELGLVPDIPPPPALVA